MNERGREVEALAKAIAATRAAFVDALQSGDAFAAAALYDEHARLLAPSAELIQGPNEIAAFWQAGIDSGISEVEIESLQLERHGGVAYEIGRYALRLEVAEGVIVVDRGKYALVHERQDDGRWLRAVETFNPDLPAGLTPPDPPGRRSPTS
jgi:ketosteroid isomerase-like protein